MCFILDRRQPGGLASKEEQPIAGGGARSEVREKKSKINTKGALGEAM